MKLIPQFVALLLSGCSVFGDPAQTCKILDPDLALATYHGGCKNGLADGYGEVSGIGSYRGDFLAGKKHGKGIKVMPNGDRYTGDFKDDYRDGRGVYEWGNKTQWAGDRYEGEYQRDLRHGQGVIQWGNGDRYEGAWQNDARGPSVMELRRAQASEAIAKTLRVGEQVCAVAQPEAVKRQHVRGKVESVTGTTMQVRIIGVKGDATDLRGIVVKVGDVLSDDAVYWQSCEQN